MPSVLWLLLTSWPFRFLLHFLLGTALSQGLLAEDDSRPLSGTRPSRAGGWIWLLALNYGRNVSREGGLLLGLEHIDSHFSKPALQLTVLPLLPLLTCPDLTNFPFGFKSLQVHFFPPCLVLSRLLQPHLPILDFRNLLFFTKSALLGGRAAGTLDAEAWTSGCYTVM